MSRFLKPVAGAATMGLVAFVLTACGVGGLSRADRLETDMQDAAMSVPGVKSAQAHINMNTSGNFLTMKLVGTGSDEAALTETLREALPVILEKTEDLQSGTLAISIFSPDDAVSAGPSSLGYHGGTSLTDFREFFDS